MRAQLALTLLAILVPAASALAMPPGSDGVALREAATSLAQLRVQVASETLDRLAQVYPNDPDVRFERALSRFYRGDYTGAVSDLGAIREPGRLRPRTDQDDLGTLIRATHQTTEHFVTARSDDGRYVVRHAPGPDAVLVPYAILAMQAADRAIGEELGVRPPGPLRIEIYPTAASLARVSSLTEEEIERTGTIALCKWDRLMVTSPRALVRGYPWMDTIGHELVHLYLARASRDRAPVWFQEGMAKFFERRWRGEPASSHLDPASEGLLSAAATGGTLLPFDRLHPSIARLDSQEEAALAFAQVATFIEAFHAEHGSEGLRAAVAQMASGTDAREALASVAGTTFATLESRWRATVSAREAPPSPPALLQMRLRQGEGAIDESADVEVEEARRHLRLGDLLWDRRRPEAAAIEYGRAHRLAPDDPILAARYARAALEGGRPREAVDALRSARERFPDHAPTWAVSGAAWFALANLSRAREALRAAIRVNPFDPEPHCTLAGATDDPEEAARESGACAQLGGGSQR